MEEISLDMYCNFTVLNVIALLYYLTSTFSFFLKSIL